MDTKKKFNIFDFLVAAVVVIVLVAIAYVLVFSPAKQTTNANTVEFVVQVPSTTLDILELANSGDIVTLTGKSQATIKEITSLPAQKLALNQTTGEYKIATVPEKFDINVTVTAKASETDKDISIGNMPIKVGAKISLEGRGYSLNGAVIDMVLFNANGEEIK